MDYYKILQSHYEKRLTEFGPTAKGMDWPSKEDLDKRFKVLISITDSEEKASLLDLGCGVGLLIDFLEVNKLSDHFQYGGSDISPRMIEVAKEMHPTYSFEVRDTILHPYEQGQYDYIVMNGVLTEKQGLSQSQMIDFSKLLILNTYNSCKKGISFNIMSTHVDWKRDDLFHWELDGIVSFMVKNCSRKIRIMMDYGLYEYTVHLKK